jgi:long-chain fatty acid transport protein
MKVVSLLGVLGAVLTMPEVYADQFHYSNLIVGDRALGLGGAYTAIADDASGVYYNPAGLGFALSNDISGSANAFYQREIEYKDIIGGKSYKERSNGSLAPFFGGLQKDLIPGWVVAFGIATTDADLRDQNTLIYNKEFKAETTYGSPTTQYLHRLHLTAMVRASTTNFSVAMARRFMGNFSFGATLSYVSIEELTQISQDNQVSETISAPRNQIIQNTREKLLVSAIEPAIGFQWAFLSSWSLGVTIKKPVPISQSLKSETDYTRYQYSKTANGQTPITTVTRVEQDKTYEEPVGKMPLEVRAGVAWFASPRFIVAADVNHHSEEKSGDYILLEREAVTNFALGLEYYTTPNLPVRFGAFTNFDARPEIKKTDDGQRDHIDYLGSSLFLAWVQPNSQVSFGGVYQLGDGQAQKLGDYRIHEVTSQSVTFAFSATHNF